MHDPNFLRTFDGLRSRTIFFLWTGDEVLSNNRLQALWSIFNQTGCNSVFITKNTISEWVHPDFPLHPAFTYLSSTHKSDYLRCYLMHHYGGGYTDIKLTTKTWGTFFSQLELSPNLALGYTELAHGMPHLMGPEARVIQEAHKELIGLCAFIFRKQTPLTRSWYDELHRLLDDKLTSLETSPGRFALDQAGLELPDGSNSTYPLRWAEILGEILHPLFYAHRKNLIKADIAPVFHSYR